MKRHLVWIALMMTASGCGGNTTNGTPAAPTSSAPAAANGAPSPGPASAFDAVDGDPPHHQNLIVMTKTDGHDGNNLDAACLGVVTTYQLRAKRKQKIRWHIQNDLFNECPDLDESLVELRFDNAVMAENTDPGAPALSVLKAVKGKITARVHANSTQAADGLYKYSVYYIGKRASDPALDISGDCGGCGPGGQ